MTISGELNTSGRYCHIAIYASIILENEKRHVSGYRPGGRRYAERLGAKTCLRADRLTDHRSTRSITRIRRQLWAAAASLLAVSLALAHTLDPGVKRVFPQSWKPGTFHMHARAHLKFISTFSLSALSVAR